jgi:hypothetical protein
MRNLNSSVLSVVTLFLAVTCLGMENKISLPEQISLEKKTPLENKIETPIKIELSNGNDKRKRIVIPRVDRISTCTPEDPEEEDVEGESQLRDLNNNRIKIKIVESPPGLGFTVQTPDITKTKHPNTPFALTPKTPYTPTLLAFEGFNNVNFPKKIYSMEELIMVIKRTFPKNENYAGLVQKHLSPDGKIDNKLLLKFCNAAYGQELIKLHNELQEEPSLSPRDEKNPSLSSLILKVVTKDLKLKKELLSKVQKMNKLQAWRIKIGDRTNFCALLTTFITLLATTGTTALSVYFYVRSKNCS